MRSTHLDIRKRVARKNKLNKNRFKQPRVLFKRQMKLKRLRKLLPKRSSNLKRNSNKLKKLQKRKKNKLLSRLIAPPWWPTHRSLSFKISMINNMLEVSIWVHLLKSLTCCSTLVLQPFMLWVTSAFRMIALRRWKNTTPGQRPWKIIQEIDKNSIMDKGTFLEPSVRTDCASMETISAFKTSNFWSEIKVKILKKTSSLAL